MASRTLSVRLQYPTPIRDSLYRVVELVIVAGLLYALFVTATSGHGWVVAAAALTVFVIVAAHHVVLRIPLFISSWIGEWQDRDGRNGSHRPSIRLVEPDHCSKVVHVLWSGVGAGGAQVFACTTEDGPIHPDSYAGALTGDNVVMMTYAHRHDERLLFQLVSGILLGLRGRMQFAGNLQIKGHALSGGAGIDYRFRQYCLAHGHPFEFEAPAIICPALGFTGLSRSQMVGALYIRLVSGGPLLQWLWTHGLCLKLWPENPLNIAYVKETGREWTIDMIRQGNLAVSVDTICSLAHTLFRGHVRQNIFQGGPTETLPGTVWLFTHDPTTSGNPVRDDIVRDEIARGAIRAHFRGTMRRMPIPVLGHGALTEAGDKYRQLAKVSIE